MANRNRFGSISFWNIDFIIPNDFNMTDLSKDSLLFGLPPSHSRYTYKDEDSGQYSTFVFAENKGLLIRSKNELSMTAFQELLAIDRKGLSNADFRIEAKKFFQFVVENQSSFEVLEDYKEVYWEFCIAQGNHSFLPVRMKGTPIRPIRSFDLLKRWFEFTLTLRLENEFESMIDHSEESKLHFILDFIENEIAFATRNIASFSDLKKNLLPETELETREKKETKIALSGYLDWLNERFLSLSSSKGLLTSEQLPEHQVCELSNRVFYDAQKSELILKMWYDHHHKSHADASYLWHKMQNEKMTYPNATRKEFTEIVEQLWNDVFSSELKSVNLTSEVKRNTIFDSLQP
jgi:hypothetical protein